MRCDANVNRLHMTNGFQLRTFDMEAELCRWRSRRLQSTAALQLIGSQICNSNRYVSHQLNRAQLELVSMSLVSCNNVQNGKLHSRLHSRAANQVVDDKDQLSARWFNSSTINWGFFYEIQPNPHCHHRHRCSGSFLSMNRCQDAHVKRRLSFH